MNRRLITLAAVLCAAAALSAAPAAAQTDTASTPPTTPAQGETQGSAAAAPEIRVPRARRSLNSITYEEVRNARVANAQELIHHLRPSWLRTPRGAASISTHIDIAVFKDGVRMGSREALPSIPITVIRTVRYYTATEARQKFGGQTGTGAIEISSR